jgi:hypothetical protein
MRKVAEMGAILSGAVAACSTAFAGSVTNADLAGKTICWSGGAKITYGQDGFFYSDQVGNGPWRLDGDRLIGNGVRGEYVWIITRQGGTFHLRGVTEANVERSGKYCK